MALLFPKTASSFDTTGERRFRERLQEKLGDDYLVWHNVPVGLARRHPDFIILHPHRGVLVLEVKDWKLETLCEVDSENFTIFTEAGKKTVLNPLLQARDYAMEVVNLLQRDPQLQQFGARHAGKLVMPWGYGVVLANIRRNQFEAAGLGDVIPGHLVICQDEMVSSVDEEDFQACLWAMFNQPFPCQLTLPQIDRVRAHLFPDLRINATPGQFGLFDDQPISVPDLIQVMDFQQEQLARSLGNGHRVIHGVAGSGKTMILGFRCLQLAAALKKPILVLCYNITLRARLEALMRERGLSERVHVRHIHGWCGDMLSAYQLRRCYVQGNFDAVIEQVIEEVEKGNIPREQYGAVMVDEGHDFKPEWYQLIVQMVDKNSNSLLVLYDDAQSIYGEKMRRKFSWKSVGIEAAGRTTILKLNYRNTLEVMSVARCFADDVLKAQESEEDGIPLLAPESAGRRGAMPVLIRAQNRWDEERKLLKALHDAYQDGHSWSDMAVLCSYVAQCGEIGRVLEKAGIPCRVANNSQSKAEMFSGDDAVRITTMHSSKGLEFPVVMLPALEKLRVSDDEEEKARQVKVLYVAMTRATQKLWMSHSAPSLFVERLSCAIEQVQSSLATT